MNKHIREVLHPDEEVAEYSLYPREGVRYRMEESRRIDYGGMKIKGDSAESDSTTSSGKSSDSDSFKVDTYGGWRTSKSMGRLETDVNWGGKFRDKIPQ